MQILKKKLIMTSSCRRKHSYDTQYGVVIDGAKFDVCTFSSFAGVKTDRQTHRQNCTLYIRLIENRICLKNTNRRNAIKGFFGKH